MTFAVGTAHMLGNVSIVEKLKEAGYDVRRVKTKDVLTPPKGPTTTTTTTSKPPKGAGGRAESSPVLLIMIVISLYILC